MRHAMRHEKSASPEENTKLLIEESWWGKKDSNLRSHKTADLQSAPFATRDTPPLNINATARPNMADNEPQMTLKPAPDGEVPAGRVYGRSTMVKSTNGDR